MADTPAPTLEEVAQVYVTEDVERTAHCYSAEQRRDLAHNPQRVKDYVAGARSRDAEIAALRAEVARLKSENEQLQEEYRPTYLRDTPHSTPAECSSWHDGCNCTLGLLLATRAEVANLQQHILLLGQRTADSLRAEKAERERDAATAALKLLVTDVQDYEAWQRPCHALDVALKALEASRGK